MGKKTKELTFEEKLEQALVPVEEQPYEVPENWCWVRLRDVAKWGSGGTPSRKIVSFYEGNIPWVKTGELNDSYIYITEEQISEEATKKSSAKLYNKGTVLMAMYGATIGKTAILGVDATTNQACACAVCFEGVDNKFLFYYLQSEKNNFIYNAKGGAQPNISQEIIKSHRFPFPPLTEQQRIVGSIERLFSKLDEAKEILETIILDTENRKSAIYQQAFDGTLSKKWREKEKISIMDWEKIRFDKLGKLERGRSKHRPRNDEILFGGEYPFIQTGDVASSGMYVMNHKQTLSDIGYKQSRLFPKGTLCITIAANIGDAAILSYDCCFPDSVVGFTPYDKCDVKYMFFYLKKIKAELEYIAPATAQKNLNLKLLGSVEIKVPPVSEQKYIAKVLERQISYQNMINDRAEEVIELIDMQKKSILAKAFRGELGTNDKSEESSLELLKQILYDTK